MRRRGARFESRVRRPRPERILTYTSTHRVNPTVGGLLVPTREPDELLRGVKAGELLGNKVALITTPQLLAAAQRAGAALRERTVVSGIDATGDGYRLQTSDDIVRCRYVVNAAGGWSGRIADMLSISLPVRSAPQQMLVTQAVATRLPFLLSVAARHLSMKQAANGNLLIGGGWPAAFDAERGRSLTRRDSIAGNLWVAQHVYPAIRELDLIRSWGAVGVMIDGAPIIGELPGHPGFYTVVGANGYTMAPALGSLVAELITSGNASMDLAPFSPARFAALDDTDKRNTT